MFQMNPVTSSTIAAMGHDSTQSVMRVQFLNGSSYDYQHVPSEVYAEIMQAASVGSTFNALVKKHPEKYPYQKVM